MSGCATFYLWWKVIPHFENWYIGERLDKFAYIGTLFRFRASVWLLSRQHSHNARRVFWIFVSPTLNSTSVHLLSTKGRRITARNLHSFAQSGVMYVSSWPCTGLIAMTTGQSEGIFFLIYIIYIIYREYISFNRISIEREISFQ